MSETTSFFGGAAIAGLAVLVLSRGAVNPAMPTPQPLPAPSVSALTPTSPSTLPSPPVYTTTPQDETQKFALDQLKSQFEQQKNETERLKDKVQKQQETIETLTLQLRENTLNASIRSPQTASDQNNNAVLSGLLWAVGGVFLTLGGGIVVLGMFFLFARQQQQTTRSVEVIHPLSEIETYIDPSRRYVPALPPRRTVRRAKHIHDL